MDSRIFILNSFTIDGKGGNPAGVVLDSDSLSSMQKQQIALKAGFSETAFILKSKASDYKVEFYTPFKQVDLCGHATIAVFSYLYANRMISAGSYTQETLAGTLGIVVRSDGKVFMEQNPPQFYEKLDKAVVAESLGLKCDSLSSIYPVQCVSTGLKDIFVPVNTLNDLNNIRADLKAISSISEAYGASGYHVFTLETLLPKSTAHCRNFAPLCGIDEESATGTSSGALACYLRSYGICNSEQMSFEQGYVMDRPSEINAIVRMDNNGVQKVMVGGRADIIGSRIISL